MLPYFQITAVQLGPFTIQVWGLWVSLGIISGLLLAGHLVKKYCLARQVIFDLAIWAIVGGFIGGRAFHVLFYDPAYYFDYPLEIIKFWRGGASSLGGLAGAFSAIYLFARQRRFTWQELLPYFDIGTISFWLGWGIGRLGCAFIHDHRGSLSNFILSVNFPDGARHDLGLYESLLAFVLFAFFYWSFKRLVRLRWGLVAWGSLLVYSLARFLLDFLRADDLLLSDPRYFYLTPAQWGMLVIFLSLTFAVIWSKIRRDNAIIQQ